MKLRVLIAVVLGLMTGSLGTAFACDICDGVPLIGLEWCVMARENETGYSECHTISFFGISSCVPGGDFCTNMNVSGGGGGAGGGSGSGGTTCVRSPGGACPANCASCPPAGNPGGRPPI